MISSTLKRHFAKQFKPFNDCKILVAGCQGQIGVPLVQAICDRVGKENVIASDVSD